ncbi:MAG: hypothetical protein GEU79_12375 [Acidimicrobiia bacterium]|nr:hypothetical protein [Acidimicrobiia bacterium]
MSELGSFVMRPIPIDRPWGGTPAGLSLREIIDRATLARVAAYLGEQRRRLLEVDYGLLWRGSLTVKVSHPGGQIQGLFGQLDRFLRAVVAGLPSGPGC